jgi:hypothetical protein
LEELFASNGVKAIASVEVGLDDAIDLGQLALGEGPDRSCELENRGIGEPVVDVQSFLASLDQARPAQGL